MCFVCMVLSRPIILNECTENRDDCDTNAECTIRPASFNARALSATWNMVSTDELLKDTVIISII